MRAIAALLILLVAAPAAASDWLVVPAQSGIAFSPGWNGEAVEGRFPKFSAAIRFDPAKLAQARVDVSIDLAAATTNDKTVNASLPGADWFDVKKHPVARFQSTSITQVKPGQYLAKGTLSLRGISQPVTLTFSWTPGAAPVLFGRATVKRLDFKVGEGQWADVRMIPNPIAVSTRVVFKPATP